MTHHCDGLRFVYVRNAEAYPFHIIWMSPPTNENLMSKDGVDWITTDGVPTILSEALKKKFEEWKTTDIQFVEPCPFCEGTPILTDLEDEDERRWWVRELQCESCEVSMRESITFNTYASMPKAQAALLVATKLIEKWNKRGDKE